jgi:hypothetical protein
MDELDEDALLFVDNICSARLEDYRVAEVRKIVDSQ